MSRDDLPPDDDGDTPREYPHGRRRQSDNEDHYDERRPDRSLTPIGGIRLLDTEVIILKGIAARQQDELRQLEEWRTEHNLMHATRDAILLGDDKTPGQLDRIEQNFKEHEAIDDKRHHELMTIVMPMRQAIWKMTVAASVGAAVAFSIWELAGKLGLIK